MRLGETSLKENGFLINGCISPCLSGEKIGYTRFPKGMVTVGPPIARRPRTDPDLCVSHIRLLPQVMTGMRFVGNECQI